MSSVGFVRVCDTETYYSNPASAEVTAITLTLPQQIKAGDLLLLVMNVYAGDTLVTFTPACSRASARNTWDSIGHVGTPYNVKRWGCLVRFPLEAGDTITIVPGSLYIPLSYVATLLHFSGVLSLASARYTNIADHLDIGHQVGYGAGGADDAWNVTCFAPSGLMVAGGMPVATLDASSPTAMQAAVTYLGSPIDMSAWTERVDQQASPGTAGRSLGIWTKPLLADTSPGNPSVASDFYGAIADSLPGGVWSGGYMNLAPGYRLAFTIISACDSAAKRWVSIALDNGETHYSNENGEAYFTVAAGTYGYTITFSDYTTVTGSVVVSADTTVSVSITPTNGCPPTGGTDTGITGTGADCSQTGGRSTVAGTEEGSGAGVSTVGGSEESSGGGVSTASQFCQ